MIELEIWADSFHEGEWCCNQLGTIVCQNGGTHQVVYKNGFIPVHTIQTPDFNLVLTVYGSYKSWSPIPKEISALLSWGKPDFIAYDAKAKKILFAVEETAAVPTGNQALQRCERIFGSARKKIPFWYLLSEFGQHKDGGIRRDSIWPTIMALKLTYVNKTPCVVLHYSDSENPENYTAGNGLKSLFTSLFKIISNYVTGKSILHDMSSSLKDQYQSMLEFVHSQWQEIIDFLPGEENLLSDSSKIAQLYADAAEGKPTVLPENFLVWPKVIELPEQVAEKLKEKELIKDDILCRLLERDVGQGKGYCLSDNAGSKPQTKASIISWVKEQKELFYAAPALTPPAKFDIDISDFPVTKNGNYHVTTSKNIVYLYDRWHDLRQTIEEAYPRLHGKLPSTRDEDSVLMYISNSITPGRIFGDPYTGQLSAFATIFGKLDHPPRMVVAYFPHQSHTQALPGKRKNKGLTLMSELTDLLIFTGGVAISLQTGEVY